MRAVELAGETGSQGVGEGKDVPTGKYQISLGNNLSQEEPYIG